MGVDVAGRSCDGAGGAFGFGLFHDQLGRRSGGGQGCPFGDAVAADFLEHDVGRIGEAGSLRLQRRRVEKPHGQAEGGAQVVDGGLVHLHVDGGDAGDGPRCQTVFRQGVGDKCVQF